MLIYKILQVEKKFEFLQDNYAYISIYNAFRYYQIGVIYDTNERNFRARFHSDVDASRS